MNIKNLKAIADLCRTITGYFDMGVHRLQEDEESETECWSGGDALGYSTVLEPGRLPRDEYGNIKFTEWGEAFTGLEWNSNEWRWCFGEMWAGVDDTAIGAAKRIEWLLAGKQIPDMQNGATKEMVAMYS